MVVNFDAVETFFSDKRPFFTENQSIFVLRSPEEENLIYTRRAGGNRDDGNGVSDIDLASKISGSAAGFDYGMFVVAEADRDEVGRSIAAFRTIRPSIALAGASLDLGYLGSYVERPFIQREAQVHSVDARFDHGAWQLEGVLLRTMPDAERALLNSGNLSNRVARDGTGGAGGRWSGRSPSGAPGNVPRSSLTSTCPSGSAPSTSTPTAKSASR
ncbi:hypothetical protein HC761_00540 [bacterium]|nr:hypothetical protein [bacterium]